MPSSGGSVSPPDRASVPGGGWWPAVRRARGGGVRSNDSGLSSGGFAGGAAEAFFLLVRKRGDSRERPETPNAHRGNCAFEGDGKRWRSVACRRTHRERFAIRRIRFGASFRTSFRRGRGGVITDVRIHARH